MNETNHMGRNYKNSFSRKFATILSRQGPFFKLCIAGALILCFNTMSAQEFASGEQLPGPERQAVYEVLRDARKLMIKDPKRGIELLDEIYPKVKIANDSLLGMWYECKGVYHGVSQREDSSLYYLELALEKYTINTRKYNQMLRLIGMRHNNLGNRSEAYDYLKAAFEMAKHRNDSVTMAISLGDMGLYWRAVNDDDNAANYLAEAMKYVEEASTPAAKDIKYTLMQHLGTLAMDQGDSQLAISLFKDVMEWYRGKDAPGYLSALISLGGVYLQNSEPDTAIKYYLEAVEIGEKAGITGYTGYTLGLIGRAYASKDEFGLSRYYFDKSLKVLDKTDFLYKYRILALYLEVLNARENYRDAVALYDSMKVEENMEKIELNDKPKLLSTYAIAAMHTGREKEAELAFTEYFRLKDTIEYYNRDNVAEQMKEKFKTEMLVTEKEMLETRNQVLEAQVISRMRWLILGFVLLLSLIATVFIFLRMIKQRKQMEADRFELSASRNSLLEEKAKADQEVIRLNEELLAQQKRDLQEHALQSGLFYEKIEGIEKIIKSGDIQVARENLKKLRTENDFWDRFRDRFMATNPNFVEKIQNMYPDLTRGDLRFAAMIRSGMSNKELAILFNISEEGVYKRRARISKKLNLDSARELDQSLMAIE